MPEAGVGRVVRDRFLALGDLQNLVGRDVEEFRLRVNEVLDQPATRDPIGLETVSWVCAQMLTSRSNCSIKRARSGGVIQLPFIHVRSSSVAPRATAHPFQT